MRWLAMTLGVCVRAVASSSSSRYGPGPCDGAALRNAPWCDGAADFATRAAALVANLTRDEKASLFVNQQGAVPRLALPAYNWWSEALHGVARDGVATSFPQVGSSIIRISKGFLKRAAVAAAEAETMVRCAREQRARVCGASGQRWCHFRSSSGTLAGRFSL